MLVTIISCACLSGFVFACQASPAFNIVIYLFLLEGNVNCGFLFVWVYFHE